MPAKPAPDNDRHRRLQPSEPTSDPDSRPSTHLRIVASSGSRDPIEGLRKLAAEFDTTATSEKRVYEQERRLAELLDRIGDHRGAERHRKNAQLMLRLIQADNAEELRLLEFVDRLTRGSVEELAAYIYEGNVGEVRSAVESLAGAVQSNVAVTSQLREDLGALSDELASRLDSPVRDRQSALSIAAKIFEFVSAVVQVAHSFK